MALEAKLLIFTKNTGTGNQSITGAGFAPKGVVLFTGGATASGAFQAADDGGVGVGLLDASGAASGSEAGRDGVVTTFYGQQLALTAFRVINSAGTITAAVGSFTLDSDGFTLNWTTNDGLAQVMYALCLGGADITNVKAHSFTLPTATGNFSVTGVGFQPDFVLFLRGVPLAGSPPYNNGGAGRVSLGVMNSSGEVWALTILGQTGFSPSPTTRGFYPDTAITNFIAKFAFVSMDADGYTGLVSASGFTSNNACLALAIKGGRWKIGTTTKPTGAAPATHAVTGVGYTPRAVLLAGIQRAGSSSVGGDAEAEVGLGIASATTARAAVARVGRNAVNPTIEKRYQDSAKIYVKVDNGTPAVDAAADLTSLDTDGFTVTWNPNDAVATVLGYVAMGDNAAAPTGGNAVFDGYYGNRPFMRGGR